MSTSIWAFPIRVPPAILEELGAFTGNFWSDSLALEPHVCDAIRNYMKPPPAQQPQQLRSTATCDGSGNRNAWKAIWLGFPGSQEWLLADVCRAARKAAIADMMAGTAHWTDAGG